MNISRNRSHALKRAVKVLVGNPENPSVRRFLSVVLK